MVSPEPRMQPNKDGEWARIYAKLMLPRGIAPPDPCALTTRICPKRRLRNHIDQQTRALLWKKYNAGSIAGGSIPLSFSIQN
jgi:hypothetical protein